MIDEATEESAALYVLGLLGGGEKVQFEANLRQNEQLARLVAELEIGVCALAYEVRPIIPPAALKERILSAARAETIVADARQGQGGTRGWAMAALVIALVGVGSMTYSVHAWRQAESMKTSDARVRETLQAKLQMAELQLAGLQASATEAETRFTTRDKEVNDLHGQLQAAREEVNGLRAQLEAARQQVAGLQSRVDLSQLRIAMLTSLLHSTPKATAIIAWDETAQRGLVRVKDMPVAHADQDYQLWIIDPEYKQPVSAGVFAAQGSSPSSEFRPVQPIRKANKFAVSLERKGGSPSPQGPIVLLGE